MRLAIVLAMILLSGSAWSQVKVPHSFEAGTVAKAAAYGPQSAPRLRLGAPIGLPSSLYLT